MSKLKVGDVVKITRKAEEGENGWDNAWVREMDIFVGKNGVVVDLPSDEGVKVYCLEAGEYYSFPEFILKKIDGGSMSEFKVGDKVRAKHDIETQLNVVKKGSIGVTVLSDPKHKDWSKILFGKELFTFDFDGTIVIADSEDVEKLEPENTETPEPEFIVGDRVKFKVDCDYKKESIREDVRGLLGTVEEVFPDGIPPHGFIKFDNPDVSNWFVAYTSLEKISEEKLEPQNIETPKKEKKLERITITLKNRQSAIVIIGNYVSADAEFVYYESRDGKTYEIREDEIIMIVSEEFNDA